ncbi:MAG: DUF2887 domain-containing protein [Cyanophyceae cyanobacterium]
MIKSGLLDYEFSTQEGKDLAFRLDGIFLSSDTAQPIYFVEVQLQRDPNLYDLSSAGFSHQPQPPPARLYLPLRAGVPAACANPHHREHSTSCQIFVGVDFWEQGWLCSELAPSPLES